MLFTVVYFVVVPQHHLTDFAVEAAHVLVHQVVLVRAAELVECFGGLGFRLCHQVLPDLAVVQLDLRQDGLVGVNRVAQMDEDIRLDLSHRIVEAQAAPFGVDTPTLTNRVRRPDECHVTIGRGCRCGDEAARRGSADTADVPEVLEQHAIENPLTSWKIAKNRPRSEVRAAERRRPLNAPHVGEAIGGCVLDDHARRPVAAAPDDEAIRTGGGRGNTLRQRREGPFSLHDGGGSLGEQRSGRQQPRGTRQRSLDECPSIDT